MCRLNRVLLALGTLSVSFAVVGLGAPALRAEDEGSVKIKFPKEESIEVDLKCGKVELRSVTIEGAPSHHDIAKARHHRDETSNLRWIFNVENEGKHERKVTIKVKVYSDDKEELAKGSRTDTISGDTDKDHISVWTKILTVDYPKADYARVSAECERN